MNSLTRNADFNHGIILLDGIEVARGLRSELQDFFVAAPPGTHTIDLVNYEPCCDGGATKYGGWESKPTAAVAFLEGASGVALMQEGMPLFGSGSPPDLDVYEPKACNGKASENAKWLSVGSPSVDECMEIVLSRDDCNHAFMRHTSSNKCGCFDPSASIDDCDFKPSGDGEQTYAITAGTGGVVSYLPKVLIRFNFQGLGRKWSK